MIDDELSAWWRFCKYSNQEEVGLENLLSTTGILFPLNRSKQMSFKALSDLQLLARKW